ncbi:MULTISPECIES: DUF5592 family protein [unclassified Clostridioides]|uniref:DUF5592 family protein n=1 Tax=unclassified Clostridioides TaxID=2635829 RepID=UPI001D11A4D8|nr:hypothetical protein [Clostridioides sp. ZZV14-6048]MCC0739998.1 hypothetical protein [Clostridioides sp. ZZV14-5902]
MYYIPEEIRSETKIFRSLYISDLAFLVVTLLLAWVMSSIVYPPLVIPYYIFTGVSALFLLAKSSDNPGSRNYKTIYFLLTKSRHVYHIENYAETKIQLISYEDIEKKIEKGEKYICQKEIRMIKE